MKLAASIAMVVIAFGLIVARAEAGFSSLAATPISVIEGSVFNGTVATFTSPDPIGNLSATINWGDGSPVSTGTINGSGNFTVTGSHTYADDGFYTFSVTVNDTIGGGSATVSATAHAGEAVLSQVSANGNTVEGQATSFFAATLTDPGSTNPASDYSATIDWGDGTVTTATAIALGGGAYAMSGTHTYADEGTFTVLTTSFDKDDPTFTISTQGTMTVQEGDVLTPHPTTFSATEGTAFNGTVASFTDTYTGNIASDFTATINWGDGSPVSAGVVAGGSGTFNVSGNHTYKQAGAYSVTVVLTDDAPGTATATAVSTANVADVPLTATGINPSFVAGVSASQKVAHFTDANSFSVAADFTATINWGDGSLPSAGSIVVAAGGGFDVFGTHTYAVNGTFTITTSINDVGGSTATATSTAKLGADLAVTKSGPVSAVVGTNLTYPLTITNNGPADAQGVSLSDALPANTSFVSASQSTGPAFTCTTPPVGTNGTITCTIATLAAGDSASFSDVLMIAPGTPAGTVLSNTATGASSIPDPAPGNNTSTVNTTVAAGTAPAITSANATAFTVGTAGSFTVTATGTPSPTLAMTGTPPSLVTFNPATGVLSGTPAAGTQGVYTLTFTASNGVVPNATQTFTLTVNPAPILGAPTITSPNATTFSIGTPGSFTVTATGTAPITFGEVGALPPGLTFNPATGVLSGTPGPTAQGVFPLTFTASNGILPNASQAFTLTVNCNPQTKGCAGNPTVTVSPPSLGAQFIVLGKGLKSVPVGQTVPLQFSINNANASTLTGVGFTDTLPAGLQVAAGAPAICGGVAVVAPAGGSSISLTGASLGPTASCSFTITVTATAVGTKVNTTSTVTSNEGGPGNVGSDSITVVS